MDIELKILLRLRNLDCLSPRPCVGELLFLSGQLGNSGALGLVEGGVGPETKQTMENIKSTLERNGLGMDRIVKCTVFLADMDEWPAVNEVYKTYLRESAGA